jgi:arylsulfatase A
MTMTTHRLRKRIAWPLTIALAALVPGWFAHEAHAARQPNVVLIYTDDQSIADVGCYGAEFAQARDIATPHIDALARRGIRFTQMYAPAPLCSPSRSGLLTGRYPDRTPVNTNVGRGPEGGLSGVPTLAQTLKAAGYATALVGKWHLGHGERSNPRANGFDHWFGHLGGCIDNYSHFFYWSGPNEHDLWRNGERVSYDGKYFPDLVIDEAERFIREHRKQPFFIYVALNMPHYPYQGDERWLKHYRKAGLPYPRDLYAAFVSSMDDRIGRLTAVLDKLRLRDDTIVIFQSDHGHSVEERAHFGGGSAGPYRGAKFSLLEGGIRVPAIVSYPRGLPANVVRGQMVHGIDWLPTIAELCGAKLLDDDIDGRSIVGVLKDAAAPSPHETLYWQRNNSWAIRQGPWKLLRNVSNPVPGDKLSEKDRDLFLVNIENDPGEQKNLAARHPEIVERLTSARPSWASKQP